MADSERRLVRGPAQIWRALRWSLQGLAACWRHESSFRLECVLAVLLVPLGMWLGHTPVERVLLVSSLLVVIAMEVMNSALESLADRFGSEHDALIGRAKDMGSAAVVVLLLPRLWA